MLTIFQYDPSHLEWLNERKPSESITGLGPRQIFGLIIGSQIGKCMLLSIDQERGHQMAPWSMDVVEWLVSILRGVMIRSVMSFA